MSQKQIPFSSKIVEELAAGAIFYAAWINAMQEQAINRSLRMSAQKQQHHDQKDVYIKIGGKYVRMNVEHCEPIYLARKK